MTNKSFATLNSFDSDISRLSNQLNSTHPLPIRSLWLETSATALCGRYCYTENFQGSWRTRPKKPRDIKRSCIQMFHRSLVRRCCRGFEWWIVFRDMKKFCIEIFQRRLSQIFLCSCKIISFKIWVVEKFVGKSRSVSFCCCIWSLDHEAVETKKLATRLCIICPMQRCQQMNQQNQEIASKIHAKKRRWVEEKDTHSSTFPYSSMFCQ